MWRIRYDYDHDNEQFFSTRELAVQQIGEDVLGGILPDHVDLDEIELRTSIDRAGYATATGPRKDLGYVIDGDGSTWYAQIDGTYNMVYAPDGEWAVGYSGYSRQMIDDRWGISISG